jgi:hypothetical protein
VYVFLLYPIRATCPACFILFGCPFFISQSSAATSHCQLPIAVRPLTYARSGESSANRELLVVQLSSLLQLLHSGQVILLRTLFLTTPYCKLLEQLFVARCSLAYSRLQTWAGMRMSASFRFAESFALILAVRGE